jgi:hypothetical protein
LLQSWLGRRPIPNVRLQQNPSFWTETEPEISKNLNFPPKSIESDLSTPQKVILETAGCEVHVFDEMGGAGAKL